MHNAVNKKNVSEIKIALDDENAQVDNESTWLEYDELIDAHNRMCSF